MPKQGRGELTDKVQAKAVKLMGRDIDVVELRFMAYMHYVMVNTQKVDPELINAEEILVLNYWVAEGRVTMGDTIKITKKFWDTLSEIMYLGYVKISNKEE